MSRRLLSPVFIISAVLLLVAAVGMHPLITVLSDHYHKEPIGIRAALASFRGEDLPSFRPVSGNPGLDPIGDPEALDMYLQLFRQRQAPVPSRVTDDAILFVTYYSDARERVSHTPEVCYRQGGAVVHEIRTVDVPAPGLEGGTVRGRLLDMEIGDRRRIVMYVLCCNGRFFHDREQVRLAVGWPGDKRIYFSKVEVAANYRSDEQREAAIETCMGLLGESLAPLVADHYPTSADLHAED